MIRLGRGVFFINASTVGGELAFSSWNFTVSNPLVVELNIPVYGNDSVDYSTSTAFNCSANYTGNIGFAQLKNLSLYSDYTGTWSFIETALISGNNDSAQFSRNIFDDLGWRFVDSQFRWNCLAYDNISNSVLATSNYTFSSWNQSATFNNTAIDGGSIVLGVSSPPQEMPDNQTDGWANMTGNVLLMHMNKDIAYGGEQLISV